MTPLQQTLVDQLRINLESHSNAMAEAEKSLKAVFDTLDQLEGASE